MRNDWWVQIALIRISEKVLTIFNYLEKGLKKVDSGQGNRYIILELQISMARTVQPPPVGTPAKGVTEMKALKITPKNAAEIEAALSAVNGGHGSHTFSTFDEINALADRAEKQLVGLLDYATKAPGATFAAVSGGIVAKSYKYSRACTRIKLERRSTAWWLVEVESVKIYPNQALPGWLTLTAEQDALAVCRLRTRYAVAK